MSAVDLGITPAAHDGSASWILKVFLCLFLIVWILMAGRFGGVLFFVEICPLNSIFISKYFFF